MNFKKMFLKTIALFLLISLVYSNVYAAGSSTIKLFYPIDGINFETVTVSVPVNMENEKEKYSLNALLNKNNIPKKAFTEIPEGVTFNNISITSDSANIDFTKDSINKITNNYNFPIILDQITKTLFQFSYIKQVTFTFDGEKIDNINEWVVSEPFSRPVQLPISEKAKKFVEKLKGKTKAQIIEELKNPENLRMAVALTVYPKNVYLDAGHGGSDPGAQGVNNGTTYYEKNLNLAIANSAKSTFESYGFTVYMRRTGDTYTDFRNIAGLANNTAATCFISVHCNASINGSISGSEVYYPNQSRNANPFPNRLTESQDLATYIDGVLPYNSTIPSRGIKSGGYNVIIDTKMYAVLVECGYMSNANDLEYLINSSNQVELGDSIALGAINWFAANGW